MDKYLLKHLNHEVIAFLTGSIFFPTAVTNFKGHYSHCVGRVAQSV
jgi:hypothetical protein